MTTHLSEDRMQDYAADLLCREERAEAEQHLVACPTCTAEVRAVRALIADLADLPADVLPERDLRPDIASRIDAPADGTAPAGVIEIGKRRNPAAPRPFAERTLRSMRLPLAAAAVLLIAVTAGITSVLLRASVPSPVDGPPAVAQQVTFAGQDFRAIETRYAAATADLEALLRDANDDLPPETIALLERSLAVIDQALAEAREALRADPGDPALPGLIMAAYEQKLDLLRRAANAS
jgi:anti-sigma factor RsiW